MNVIEWVLAHPWMTFFLGLAAIYGAYGIVEHITKAIILHMCMKAEELGQSEKPKEE